MEEKQDWRAWVSKNLREDEGFFYCHLFASFFNAWFKHDDFLGLDLFLYKTHDKRHTEQHRRDDEQSSSRVETVSDKIYCTQP